MPYIKWNNSRTAYTVWHGPSLGIAAMTAQGYEKVDILPAVTPEEVPLTDLIFSKYKVNGKKQILALDIEPEIVDPEDIETLSDILIAAVNEAIKRVDDTNNAEMSKLTGALGMPGIPGLF